jgi:hypothetical protein
MCSDLCSLFDLVQVGRFMTSVLSKHGSPSLCQFLICNLTVYYGGWCYSLSAQKRHMERVKANNPKVATLGFSNLEVIGDVPGL